MNFYERRKFISQSLKGLLAFHPLMLAFWKNHINKDIESPVKVLQGTFDPFIVDLHCHPNMKYYLLRDHMYHYHFSFPGENRITMQTDTKHLIQGNVKGFLAAHHIPERGVTEQSLGYRKLLRIAQRFAPEFASKVEHGDSSNYRQLTAMLDDFEWQVEKTNIKLGKNFVRVCKNYTDFEQTIHKNQIAVAQSIEGGHCLGRNCSESDYLMRLNFLADRGICLMTLSHFFENDFSFPVEGIQPSEKEKMKIRWHYDATYDNRPLTDIGKTVARQMLNRGMLIDLTHLTPKGRSDVFNLNDEFAVRNNGRKRPIVFTHAGVQSAHISSDYDSYKYLAASDEEIGRIKECNGVIGIVFMNFWLKGMDKHTHPGKKRRTFKNGIQYVLETIDRIHDYTNITTPGKSYDHIAIGSDFDGFADAPNDLENPKFYPGLIQAMLHHGIAEQDINKITHGNAMRVLKEGWGPIA